ncbi:MAG: hypothetical protein NTW66_03380 [Candidatus Magasanikbacteria bacterium]|nr:hypothetical protein [Candidatus Magasanikbacteria bacterium]
MSLRKKINLAEGEDIAESIHSSPLFHFWHFFIGIFVLVLGAFFSFWLLASGILGSIALTAIGFIGVIIIFRAWSSSKKNFWVITNRRLIDVEKHGLLDESISATALGEIKDVFVHKKGFGALFFDYGDITVDVFSDSYALTLHGVRQPQHFADQLTVMSRTVMRRRQMASSQLAINNFYRVLPSLGLNELIEVKNRIENQVQNHEE